MKARLGRLTTLGSYEVPVSGWSYETGRGADVREQLSGGLLFHEKHFGGAKPVYS